ncbi:hypothetical protein F442_21935 [Phytophthora nicotianae P10297]|uniref:Uncharacterized protein n=5 Tax=Phytophthora nicotianae TaxID=4792 RepID=V9DVM5_PHYNI|nr:hypothetical protein F443_22071 [Phytophthora nicotianae P1569]ETL24698.1 hypothetical protein L916_21343 [Phytophthora nicotianae]ETO59614.1 hypothetical protein F444_22090 [Phytophthora nicotianae P1976]ETP28853.1 hypothetical protein F442_21935 [Phytophthora nicotianae P10297]
MGAIPRKRVNPGRTTPKQLMGDPRPPRQTKLGDRRVVRASNSTGTKPSRSHLRIGRHRGRWSTDELTSTKRDQVTTGTRQNPAQRRIADEQRTDGRTVDGLGLGHAGVRVLGQLDGRKADKDEQEATVSELLDDCDE